MPRQFHWCPHHQRFSTVFSTADVLFYLVVKMFQIKTTFIFNTLKNVTTYSDECRVVVLVVDLEIEWHILTLFQITRLCMKPFYNLTFKARILPSIPIPPVPHVTSENTNANTMKKYSKKPKTLWTFSDNALKQKGSFKGIIQSSIRTLEGLDCFRLRPIWDLSLNVVGVLK